MTRLFATRMETFLLVFENSYVIFYLVPQLGTLHLRTEFGLMDVAPGEICGIPYFFQRINCFSYSSRNTISSEC